MPQFGLRVCVSTSFDELGFSLSFSLYRKIIPMIKSNYRPVSCLISASKVLEFFDVILYIWVERERERERERDLYLSLSLHLSLAKKSFFPYITNAGFI